MADDHQEQPFEKALTEDMLGPDPVACFEDWWAQARECGMVEPTAMTLASVDAQGDPDARIVLLKGIEDRGFVFYTNYASEKGQQLAAQPKACLVFWWERMARQVRVRGAVAKLPSSVSDAYFASRPRGSRIGAWASAQSTALEDRSQLEQRVAEIESRFRDQDIPRPEHWGGYRLDPAEIEFWQGRSDRLHDRFLYRREDGGWATSRLSP